MRLVLAMMFALAGCVTVTVQPPSKTSGAVPTFPQAGRTPAAADANANVPDTWMEQLYCANGSFYYKAETARTDYPGHANCLILSKDEMHSSVSINLKFFSKHVSGNFADVVLEKALRQPENSYRDMPMPETRDYLVRSGQCGMELFFTVIPAKYAAPPPAANAPVNTAARNCTMSAEFKLTSNLPLAGVYPRVYGESLQSFVVKLQSK